jgi:hypothetical protein
MKKFISILFCAFFLLDTAIGAQRRVAAFDQVCDSLVSYMSQKADFRSKFNVEKAVADKDGKLIIRFSSGLADYAIRDEDVEHIYDVVKNMMPSSFASYKNKFKLICGGVPVESLKSNFYSSDPDRSLVAEHNKYVEQYHKRMEAPLVTNKSRSYSVSKGLQGRHIAIWQSHGWYYEQSLKRWEWQRARILETVEDLYTQSYVLPFLTPMLENAGANVLLPRERDWNKNEVIVDNDSPSTGYQESGKWSAAPDTGFADRKPFYLYKENPFKMGTARMVDGRSQNNIKHVQCTASWTPDFPESGEYAVYVSYQTVKNSTAAAPYEVRHKGGVTRFSVNQKMGGGTWVYLGKFLFEKGNGSGQGVYLTNDIPEEKSVVTADAVKFGGGMGNMARKPAEVDPDGKPLNVDFSVEPEISGYPRFTEGSRYWLQWAGFNDTIYSPNRNMTDYNDDYMSRGKWVNTLSDGSYLKPKKPGYNIPLDLSFAFHTDAGTFLNDSIVGSLSIYTRLSNGDEEYPHGEQRIIAREYADIVQTQIVNDVRAFFEPNWSRRFLWDRSYAESRSPEVPAMLLELLSHQNLADMRYGLDPTFRFCVSRAIYKGMLKYLSFLNDTDYVVQPLPVNSFSAVIDYSDGKYFASLKWKPSPDPIEETAVAKDYVLYTRIGNDGFNNGVRLGSDKPEARIEIIPGKIYSFKVSAINDGGESFPSEILAVGVADGAPADNSKTVMVVNNFTRLSAPASFASPDSTTAGFRDFVDAGVSYIQDISYIGAQHEFRREIPWMDDDAPGFAASYADQETNVIAGNTFDFPYIHGVALMKAGYSFVSSSSKAIADRDVKLIGYPYADFICGKQVTTMVGRKGASELKYRVFPAELQSVIADYAKLGGRFIVSGANIATDIWDKVYEFDIDSTYNAQVVKPSKVFAETVLRYKWMTNYASKKGEVKAEQNPFRFPAGKRYSFHMDFNDERYQVDSPDALVPVGDNARTIFRYSDNDISAGVAYIGMDYRVVSLGFPIETLQSQEQINSLIGDLMKMLSK